MFGGVQWWGRPPPAKKTKKVSGDQGDDKHYPIPGLDDDLLQNFY